MLTDYDKDALIRRLADAVTKTVIARAMATGYESFRAWQDAAEALNLASEWLEHAPAEIQAIAGLPAAWRER